MSLKKIKRAEKKGTESVMDEKFALLFWSEFSIGNGEFHYQVYIRELRRIALLRTKGFFGVPYSLRRINVFEFHKLGENIICVYIMRKY